MNGWKVKKPDVVEYDLKYENLLDTVSGRIFAQQETLSTPMKIFFTGSPRALRFPAYKKDLQSIFNSLSRRGENLSKLVVEAVPDEFYNLDYQGVVKHYQTTVDHLKNADVVVAEVSMQSMSMGFLVNMSLGMSKPSF